MTERERLLQLIDKAEEKFPTMGDLVFKMAVEEYVADYLLANSVIVPPVRVGDTAYTLYWDDECPPMIEEAEILEVSTQRFWIDSACFDFDDIGQSVFLTEDDAEKAISERMCKNG